MASQIENFAELVTTTQNELGGPKFVNLMSDLRDFPLCKTFLKKNKIEIQSGPEVEWRVVMDHNHQAQHTAITDPDSIGNRDATVVAKIPWKKTYTGYWFYTEEMLVNRSKNRIVNLIELKRAQGLTAWFELMEDAFIAPPSSSDIRTPYGLPYWAPKNATEGFNGTALSGFTTVANINPSTYERWKSYTGQYTNFSLTDAVTMLRRMSKKTKFKPALENLPDADMAMRRSYLMNTETSLLAEDILDSRNENLGNDLAKNTDNAVLSRADMEVIPKLDDDSTNPIYQVDFGVFGLVCLKDAWNKETVIAPYPGQRNAIATFMDYIYNFRCTNRRKLGVIATGTTYP